MELVRIWRDALEADDEDDSEELDDVERGPSETGDTFSLSPRRACRLSNSASSLKRCSS